jgi:hypothetical protein
MSHYCYNFILFLKERWDKKLQTEKLVERKHINFDRVVNCRNTFNYKT